MRASSAHAKTVPVISRAPDGDKVGGAVARDRIRVGVPSGNRSEEHTSELQSLRHLVCRLLLEKIGHPPDRRRVEQQRLRDTLQQIHQIIVPSNFFNDTATPEIYTLSLHDALPI